MNRIAFSGCSVARLSRLLWEQEVAGSNPANCLLSSRLKVRVLPESHFFISSVFPAWHICFSRYKDNRI